MAPLFSAPGDGLVIGPSAVTGAGRDDLCDYLAANQSAIDALVVRHGAVLFRGFRVGTPEQFRRCAESLGATPFGYVGGDTPRTRIADAVFTATEYEAAATISLHNEMSYLSSWPRRLFFCSILPAAQGGQTPLARSADVLRAMPPEILDRFRERGISYIRHFHPGGIGKSWQATYQTDDQATAERLITAQGSRFTWLPRGVLRVTTRCAVETHPATGEHVWFNQAEQWHPSALDADLRAMLAQLVGPDQMPHDCTYGDGTPIDDGVLAAVRRVLAGAKRTFEWQRDDLLVIDNLLMMHGREAYKGQRTTLAYLSAS